MSEVRPNLLGITNVDALERVESELSRARVAELVAKPLRGGFDVDHLRAINRYIFQDLYPDAGELRAEKGPWRKLRVLSDGSRYSVYYKPSDEMARELPNVLLAAAATQWSGLKTPPTLAPAIAKVYGDLDFQHPFTDGNSRTLRAFTQLWVNERTSQNLSWDSYREVGAARDVLYRARDAEVLGRALVNGLIENEADMRIAARLRHSVLEGGDTLSAFIERGIVIGVTREDVDRRTTDTQTADRVVRGVLERYDSDVQAARRIDEPRKDRGRL